MDNTEISELEAIEQLIENANNNIELGSELERLKKNRAFKKLIEKMFLSDGKKFLWENIKLYEEADMKEKGSARMENVERFKTEVQARLILEMFFERVESDAEGAFDELIELTKAKEEIQNKEGK